MKRRITTPTPNSTDLYGDLLTKCNSQEEVKKLFRVRENKSKINNRINGFTLLHAVIGWQDHLAKVATLLQLGADQKIPDKEGNKPLHYAAKFFRPASMLILLTQYPYGVNAPNQKQQTPLHLLLEEDDWNENAPTCMQYLIEAHAQNLPDKNGDTPLHVAARKGYRQLLPELIKITDDINIRNNAGQTPLQLAEINNHLECIQFLSNLTPVPKQIENTEAQPDKKKKKKKKKKKEAVEKQEPINSTAPAIIESTQVEKGNKETPEISDPTSAMDPIEMNKEPQQEEKKYSSEEPEKIDPTTPSLTENSKVEENNKEMPLETSITSLPLGMKIPFSSEAISIPPKIELRTSQEETVTELKLTDVESKKEEAATTPSSPHLPRETPNILFFQSIKGIPPIDRISQLDQIKLDFSIKPENLPKAIHDCIKTLLAANIDTKIISNTASDLVFSVSPFSCKLSINTSLDQINKILGDQLTPAQFKQTGTFFNFLLGNEPISFECLQDIKTESTKNKQTFPLHEFWIKCELAKNELLTLSTFGSPTAKKILQEKCLEISPDYNFSKEINRRPIFLIEILIAAEKYQLTLGPQLKKVIQDSASTLKDVQPGQLNFKLKELFAANPSILIDRKIAFLKKTGILLYLGAPQEKWKKTQTVFPTYEEFCNAIKRGESEQIGGLLASGASIHLNVCKNNQTPLDLILAAKISNQQKIDCCCQLLLAGACVTQQFNGGLKPAELEAKLQDLLPKESEEQGSALMQHK